VNIQYVAGFFDGEGCLSLRKCYNNYGELYIMPAIYITNTNKEVLDNIRTYLQMGTVCSKKKKIGCKQTHVFRISANQELILFLKQIRPFVIVKKRIVNIGIDICMIRQKIQERTGVGPKKKYTEEEREQMMIFYNIAKNINKTGDNNDA
jgi:intein/homing endonuclease